jgi:holin-like protein
MRGFVILVLFQLCGMGLHRVGLPLPGTVIGLILFTASLFAGIVKLEWVEATSSLLLRNMLLFFAPVIVTTVFVMEGLKRQWIAVLASIVISMLAVMLTTGFVTHLLLGKGAKADAE